MKSHEISYCTFFFFLISLLSYIYIPPFFFVPAMFFFLIFSPYEHLPSLNHISFFYMLLFPFCF